MKRATLALASVVLVAGCSGGTLDFRNAEVSNNKIYAESENDPFSGTVTNIPLSSMPSPRISPVVEMVAASTGETNARDAIFGAGFSSMMGGQDAVVCDSPVEEGELDGEATCRFGGNKLFTVPYEGNVATGEFEVFDPNEGARVVEGELLNGVLTGESRGYSATNGQLAHRTSWINGKANGALEAYSLETGNLVVKTSLKDGKRHGDFVRYAPDGKSLLVRTSFVNDRLDGNYEEYTASGDLVRKTTYDKGVDIGELAEIRARQKEEWRQFEASQQESAPQVSNDDDVGARCTKIYRWSTNVERDEVEAWFSDNCPNFDMPPAWAEDAQANDGRGEELMSSVAPSFDCTKATSRVENMICWNEELAVLDNEMAASFKAARNSVAGQKALLDSQRSWQVTRDACGSVSCVETAYKSRLAEL